MLWFGRKTIFQLFSFRVKGKGCVLDQVCMYRVWNLHPDTFQLLYVLGKSLHVLTARVRTLGINNNNNKCIHRCNLTFSTISSPRREPSPTCTLKWPGRNRVQITCNTSSACHVQHVVLHAMWYEGTAQLLSLTEFKSHLFELYFIG